MSKQDLAGNYTTIMDSDTVELFHRDDFLPSSWLSFIHEKRAKHAHLKARFTRILYILFSSFFVVATFCLFSSVFLAYSATPEDVEVIFPLLDQCQVLTPNKRVDCNPDLPISKDVCLKRGCCWSPIGVNPTPGITTNVLPPLGVPYCYYGANYVGYQVTESRSDSQQTVIKLIRVQPSGFEDDVTDLTVVIDELSPSVMRIKLVDTQTKRYEVPIPTLNLPGADREIPKQYKIQLFSDNNTLAIYRTETGERIFHVNLAQIVYSNQFLQLTVDLPSDFIYGIGMWNSFEVWGFVTLLFRRASRAISEGDRMETVHSVQPRSMASAERSIVWFTSVLLNHRTEKHQRTWSVSVQQ